MAKLSKEDNPTFRGGQTIPKENGSIEIPPKAANELSYKGVKIQLGKFTQAESYSYEPTSDGNIARVSKGKKYLPISKEKYEDIAEKRAAAKEEEKTKKQDNRDR